MKMQYTVLIALLLSVNVLITDARAAPPTGRGPTAGDLNCTECVSNEELEANSVDSSKVVDESISSSDLGANSVGSSEVAEDAIGSDEIGRAAVGSTEVAPGAIGSAEIAPDSVGSTEIKPAAVGAIEIAPGTVDLIHQAFDTATQSELDTVDARLTNLEAIVSEGGDSGAEESFVQLAPYTFRPRSYPPKGFGDYVGDRLIHDYLSGQGIRFSTAPFPADIASTTLYSQLRLPPGAEIRSLDCYVKDDDSAQNMLGFSAASLKRVNPADGTGNAIVATTNLATTGLSGFNTFSATPDSELVVVDNRQFHYMVQVDIRMGTVSDDFFDPMFRGCRVVYSE